MADHDHHHQQADLVPFGNGDIICRPGRQKGNIRPSVFFHLRTVTWRWRRRRHDALCYALFHPAFFLCHAVLSLLHLLCLVSAISNSFVIASFVPRQIYEASACSSQLFSPFLLRGMELNRCNDVFGFAEPSSAMTLQELKDALPEKPKQCHPSEVAISRTAPRGRFARNKAGWASKERSTPEGYNMLGVLSPPSPKG
ncbi:hypothetical protein ACP70R_018308 [Stipagrostis hirtigluma subsp. patula]